MPKKQVKILQIQAVVNISNMHFIYGLGDDQQIYYWNWERKLWELYEKK